jgi:hypothetical protein
MANFKFDKRFLTACAICVTAIGIAAYVTRDASSSASNSSETPPADASGIAAAGVSRAQIADLVSSAELDPAKQKHIWDAEHITFLIENHLCKPFIAELKEKQWNQFSTWFRDDFEGRVLTGELADERRQGVVRERSLKRGAPTREVDAAGLGSVLLAGLADFSQIKRARLRVLHIDSTDEKQQVWRTRLLLTAFGENAKGGPMQRVSEHDVEFVVSDKDAFKEAIEAGPVIQRWSIASDKLRESEHYLLEEITEKAGLTNLPIHDNWVVPQNEAQQYRFKMAVADFDRDGFLDIAAAPDSLRPVLLRSVKGERFELVADELGLKPFESDSSGTMSLLASWIDYDNDGFPDLLMGDRLYHNEAGKRFTDVTERSGLKILRDPNGCVVADYDCDGLLDLYVLNQVPEKENLSVNMPWVGDTEHGAENQLWRNLGDGRFQDVTAAAGAGGGRRETFAATWLFYDGDRYPDLYVANDFGENMLLRNSGRGGFEEVTKGSGAGDYATSMGVASGDLNNDGRPEIYVANMYSKMGRRIIAHVNEKDYPEGIYEQIRGSCAGNRLYLAAGQSGRYVDLGEEMGVDAVGWAYAPSLVDLDNDGWLDIYATTGFMSFDRQKPDG